MTVIEDAQDKCMRASRLGYQLKDNRDQAQIKLAVDHVYNAIRSRDIPRLVERVKALDRVYANLRFKEM